MVLGHVVCGLIEPLSADVQSGPVTACDSLCDAGKVGILCTTAGKCKPQCVEVS